MYTRQGYLYVQNKKNLIGSQWSKHYCQYQARTHNLTMIPYSQLQGKITTTESLKVNSCVCKEEAAEKFRFVVTGEDLNNQVRTIEIVVNLELACCYSFTRFTLNTSYLLMDASTTD